MSTTPKPQCGNCRFFLPCRGQVGLCRVHPPKVIECIVNEYRNVQDCSEVAISMATNFPEPCETDWCGEHQPKEPGE